MFFLVGESSELSTKKKQTNKATWTENCCEKRHQVRPSVSRWPHRCKPKQPNRHSKRRNSLLQISPKKLTFFVFRGFMYNRQSKSGYRQSNEEASKVLQCDPTLNAIKKAITAKWGANAKALGLCDNRIELVQRLFLVSTRCAVPSGQ